jgi:hypothetical protein
MGCNILEKQVSFQKIVQAHASALASAANIKTITFPCPPGPNY